jgi:HEAT repeat protein
MWAVGRHEAVLAKHTAAVVAKLDHADAGVRAAAVEALGRHEAVLVQHATAVAAKLEDADAGVREASVEALGNEAGRLLYRIHS